MRKHVLILCCALAGCFDREHPKEAPQKASPPPRVVWELNTPQNPLGVVALSDGRYRYKGEIVYVRGEARLVDNVVGLVNPFTLRTEILCVFENENEPLRHISPGEEKYLTIKGELFETRSSLPRLERCAMLRNCVILD